MRLDVKKITLASLIVAAIAFLASCGDDRINRIEDDVLAIGESSADEAASSDGEFQGDYPAYSEGSENPTSSTETEASSSSNGTEGISSGDDGFIIPPPKTDIEEGYEAVKVLDIGGTKLYITENNVVKMDEDIVVGTYDPEKKAIFDNQGGVLVENVNKQELADDQLKKPVAETSSSSQNESTTSSDSEQTAVTYEGPLTQTVAKGKEITPIVFSNVEADPGQNNGRTWGMHYLQFQFDGNAKTYTISGKIPDYPLEENNKTETLTINGQKFTIILIITDDAESSNSVSSSSEEQSSSNSDVLSSSSESQTVVESSSSVSSSSEEQLSSSSEALSSSSESQTVVESSSAVVQQSSSSVKPDVTLDKGELKQTVMQGTSITPIVFKNVYEQPNRTNTIDYLSFAFDSNARTYTVSGSTPEDKIPQAKNRKETLTWGSQQFTIEFTIQAPSSSSAKVTVEGDLVQTIEKGQNITPVVFKNVTSTPTRKDWNVWFLNPEYDQDKQTYTIKGGGNYKDFNAGTASDVFVINDTEYEFKLTVNEPSSSSIASSSSSSESSSSTSSSSVSSSSTASSSSYSGGETPNFKIKEGGRSGQGWGSRYWDCCMPHCAWNGNTNNPTKTCNSNMDVIGESGGSACGGGSGGVCDFQAPWAASENLAYAFAAVPADLGGECGKCFLLTFNGGSHGSSARTGALNGKQMVIMVSNIGGDVGSNQFDIMIPGGGVGQFNGCGVQLGISSTGAQYGGFISDCSSDGDPVSCVKKKCSIFSKYPKLQAGCEFSATWYNAADNPTFHFAELESCPNEISSKW